MKEQVCNRCNKELPISRFEWQGNRPNPRKVCKKCRNDSRVFSDEQKKRIKIYKEGYRKSGKAQAVLERHLYGISKSEFKYNNCCICGQTKRISIDHCHTSGKVRGLLCSKCNTALGMFDDDIDKMLSAISYLQHFQNGGESFKDYPHWQLED